MQQLPDLSPFRWIQDDPVPAAQDGSSAARVWHCLPRGYEAYCKILHPIIQHPLDFEFPIEITKRTTYNDLWQLREDVGLAAVSALATARRDAQGRGERVRWRTLVEERGLTWVPEINGHTISYQTGNSWPFYLEGPVEGFIEQDILERLVELLTPYTQDQDCYFYFFLMATENFEDKLFRGRLPETKEKFPGVNDYQTPTYTWPENHSWCLYSDYDLEFTLLGGSRSLIATMLTDQVVETIEVFEDTRVDYWADHTNIKRSDK